MKSRGVDSRLLQQRYRPSALLLVVVAMSAIGFPVLIPGAQAAFTAVSGSSSNAFGADTLNAPTGPTASAGGTASIDWTATTDTYASGHRILRSSSSGGPYTQIAQITPRTTVTYDDSPAAGTYYYVVRAFYGTWESSNSTEVSATVVDVGLAGSWQTGTAHTAASGSDRMLVFTASNEEASTSTPTLSSVTYGGQALTKVRSDQVTSSGKTGLLEVWILNEAGIAAASGTTISPSWSSTPDSALYSHAVFENVDQTSPIGASTSASSSADTPNPVPMSSVATANNDMVIAAATAGETGDYTPQNGFTLGINQDSGIETTALGTAYKAADGSSVTASMLFNPDSPPWINRQVSTAFVLQVTN